MSNLKTKASKIFLACALAGTAYSATAAEKPLKSIGITVGSLGNPYYVAIAKGAEARAKAINPNVSITTVSADYDLNKQFTQIDNLIAAHVDMILLVASDAKAIEPAVRKAQAAGIIVVAVDVAAAGANATVQTNNVKAGEIACDYIAKKLNGKGNVIIENAEQVSAVVDRVNGCKSVLVKYPAIKVLSSDQNAHGSRDGGMNTMQGYLTRFPKIDGLFAVNDPEAIGSDLAAKQLHRTGIVIASVDGAPDIESALKSDTSIHASASQDPYAMAQKAVEVGNEIRNGKKPSNDMILLEPTLITRENVGTYKGWNAAR